MIFLDFLGEKDENGLYGWMGGIEVYNIIICISFLLRGSLT